MKQWSLALALAAFACPLFAADVSDECIKSMQNVYKFYYHEISPKENKRTEKLNQVEALEMQTIVNSLKSNCSTELVAKINQHLAQEADQG